MDTDSEKLIADLRAQLSQKEQELAQEKAKNRDLRAELNTYIGNKRGTGFEIWKQTQLENISINDAIATFLETSRQQINASELAANKWVDNIEQIDKTLGIPLFVSVITFIAKSHLTYAGSQDFERSIKLLRQQYNLTDANLKNPDAYIRSLLSLIQARAFLQAATINFNTAALLSQAHGYIGLPAIVAYEILEQCEEFGRPAMKTLQRLDPAWIKANLKQNPAKTKLRDGLEHVYAQARGDLNKTEFCKARGIETRTFRIYQGWDKKLRKIAIPPSELFKITNSS